MRASAPFQFVTASYLTRVCNQRARNLKELDDGLMDSTDGSIFYHTFQSLGRHHFLTEGFSNDFAQWVLAACNRPGLAEQLASIDIRDYVSVSALRDELHLAVSEECIKWPREARQRAFEPFYFCESIEEEVPLGGEVWTLEDFRAGFEGLSHASLQFHFITSRLRLHLRTNDFSQWFSEGLGLESLARRVDQIDIYTHTLDGVRERIQALVDAELRA